MELQRLRGEPSHQPAANRAERPAQTVQPAGWAPSLRHRSAAMDRGWVLRLGVQRPGLGRGLELAAGRQPEGPGAWSSSTRGVLGRSPALHSSNTSSPNSVPRAGPH